MPRSGLDHESWGLDFYGASFRKRFFALSADELGNEGSRDIGRDERRLTLRKSTMKALENRRDNVFGTLDKKRKVSA